MTPAPSLSPSAMEPAGCRFWVGAKRRDHPQAPQGRSDRPVAWLRGWGGRGLPPPTLLDRGGASAASAAAIAAAAAAAEGGGDASHLCGAASWFQSQQHQGAAAETAAAISPLRDDVGHPATVVLPVSQQPAGQLPAEHAAGDLSSPGLWPRQQSLQQQQHGSSMSDDTDNGRGGPMCTPDTQLVCGEQQRQQQRQQQQRGDLYAQPADGPGGGFKVSN